MKYRSIYLPPSRDGVQESEPLNFKLLSKGGYIKKGAVGVFHLLPLGNRVLERLIQMIISPLEAFNISKISPADHMSADELYKQIFAGRLNEKELPIGVAYIQDKAAPSIRARQGLLCAKQWKTVEGMVLQYDKGHMQDTYEALQDTMADILSKLNISYVKAQKVSWNYPGERDCCFFLPYSSGDTAIGICKDCGLVSTADSIKIDGLEPIQETTLELSERHTPNVKTIAEVAEFLELSPKDIVKTLIYKADHRLIGVLVRGDRDLSEVKLKTLLGSCSLVPASSEEVYQATGAEVGFAGPVGLKAEIICDQEVAVMDSMVVGANKSDHHLINVCINRDFVPSIVADLRTAAAGDMCPNCGSVLQHVNGFVIASIHKKDADYAKQLGVSTVSKESSLTALDFQINLFRVLAAAVEVNQDQSGIIMPAEIAPFDIVVLPVHRDNEMQMDQALKIYNQLESFGFCVALDDRAEKVHTKFKDADSIGIPMRVTVGRKIEQGIVEVKQRGGDTEEMEAAHIMQYLSAREVQYAEKTK